MKWYRVILSWVIISAVVTVGALAQGSRSPFAMEMSWIAPCRVRVMMPRDTRNETLVCRCYRLPDGPVCDVYPRSVGVFIGINSPWETHNMKSPLMRPMRERRMEGRLPDNTRTRMRDDSSRSNRPPRRP